MRLCCSYRGHPTAAAKLVKASLQLSQVLAIIIAARLLKQPTDGLILVCTRACRFEWVDGALTRAIEEGQWVLLDNANLCNPTVLDRLNPLLEPGGALYLNECGTPGGQPRIIRPHPNFRLFLALDPR